jgi:uncharacterized protein
MPSRLSSSSFDHAGTRGRAGLPRPLSRPALALALAVLGAVGACSKKTDPSPADAAAEAGGSVPNLDADSGADAAGPELGTGTPVTREALLGALGSCAASGIDDFATRAATLEAAVKAWAAAGDTASLMAAQTAFRAAWDSWQVLEVMQFGPAAPFTAPGGQGLRDHIYSWPLVSRCAIEEQIVARGWEAPNFSSSLVNRRGLAALEYLLFFTGADSACPATSTIIATGSWAALTPDDRAQRTRAYAAAAATDLNQRATALRAAWAGPGKFLATFSSAGPGNATFPSAQKALNAAFDALFYVDFRVKDAKLAPPLGLRDCAAATCPELFEARFAQLALPAMRANHVGFSRLLRGCGADYTGLGFDDLLIARGADDLAARLVQRTAAIGSALAAITTADLDQALAANPASVRALYDSWKGVTDLMKTELLTVLDLEIPKHLEGDND